MQGMQLSLLLDPPPPATPPEAEPISRPPGLPGMASGEKTKARQIIAAIRTLQAIERDQRPATPEEKQTLARFSGFGPVALSIFPDPVTGKLDSLHNRAAGG